MRKAIITLSAFLYVFVPGTSSALSIGDNAPGFEAHSTHGNVILSEFEGKKNVVLALYFADFTRV